MGADITGRDGGRLAPLVIRGGPLRGIHYRMPAASAQVKSALLLAGLYAEGETVIEEPAPTRDHTERMLRKMGADLQFGEGAVIRIRPRTRELEAMSLRVPGDISSAAPWLVLASAHPDAAIQIVDVGVNPTRTGILDCLTLMGADIRLENERLWGAEPVANIAVRSSQLRGITIGGDLVPRPIAGAGARRAARHHRAGPGTVRARRCVDKGDVRGIDRSTDCRRHQQRVRAAHRSAAQPPLGGAVEALARPRR